MQRTDSLEKDPDAGKDGRQEEKGVTEDEMVGWNHQELVIDRKSWYAAVCGVAKSQTRLRTELNFPLETEASKDLSGNPSGSKEEVPKKSREPRDNVQSTGTMTRVIKEENYLGYGQVGTMRNLQFSSVQFSRSVVSDSLRPHESQHARPPCPSPAPGVYSNLCPSSR